MFKGIYIGIIVLSFFAFGCNKKAEQQATQMPGGEEMMVETAPESIAIQSTETLAEPTAQVKTVPPKEIEKTQGVASSTTTLGFVKPLTKDIQLALQNAGFYKGIVDGKTGPQTKQAIKDFQLKNSLKADGKVGPTTWDKLKAYLEPTTKSKSKKAKS